MCLGVRGGAGFRKNPPVRGAEFLVTFYLTQLLSTGTLRTRGLSSVSAAQLQTITNIFHSKKYVAK